MAQIILLSADAIDRRKAAATIGHNIQVARIAARLSLTALGQKIGASAQYLSMVENGRKAPSSRILVSIRDVLGVSLDYLMSDEGVSVQAACEREVMRASESQHARYIDAREKQAKE